MNSAAARNEERREAEVEYLSSGEAVLAKVTWHLSVFTRGDLQRAVKVVPDMGLRERLVEEALAHGSVVSLFDNEGRKSKYYTTASVRAEEEKLLRLCGYVVNIRNVFLDKYGVAPPAKIERIKKLGESLTKEQQDAFNALIKGEGGLRIVRGRAGSGKSHVLKAVSVAGRSLDIHVIGLAPTHKARVQLSASGFDHTDTVKGMLFKLANGRFNLPKNSLLVVDEAGMVGNDDYSELLRVAATRGCNVILSGDERQLTSVQRGGMFEVFAERYGSSTIVNTNCNN